jgi:hypothetical protein
MAFRPIIPYSGQDGWTYLRDTLTAQRAKYDAQAPVSTEIRLVYFSTNIGSATTAQKLLDDPTLVGVALDAFGLSKAKPTRAFAEAALTADTRDEAAFLARFGDARWLEMAKAFGYGGDGAPAIAKPGFADDIAARVRLLGFEEAIGAAEPAFRRALVFDRAIQSVAAAGFKDEIEGWARALGDDATRRVLKGALGLGSTFDTLAPEAQAAAARDAYARLTGETTVDVFADASARDAMVRRYLDAERRGLTTSGSTSVVLTGSGMRAWTALEASLDTRQTRFDAATRREPDLVRFAAKIAAADTPAKLAADETLTRVALKAFGLGAAKPTAAFLARVLASDTDDPKSFANGLGDPRWAEMARAFGYGDGRGPQVAEEGFADAIAARWRVSGLADAVGAQDDAMRLALLFDRAMESLAGEGRPADEGWKRALGHPPVAWVLQQALDLPDDFATRRPDERVALVEAAAKSALGVDDVAGFASERVREATLSRFFDAEAKAERVKPQGLGQPLIPTGGVAGWRFLQRTIETQQARFNASAPVMRETAYFRENIGKIETAEDLVKDRRLLTVALEAYGLESEIDKRYFLKRVLEEGSENPAALARRLSDPKFREFAAAFGFGDGQGARTRTEGFAETVVARYRVRAFERAVGEQDESLRLALYFDRTAQALAGETVSEEAQWLRLLGDVPMRRVVETALGLPPQFAQIEIDTQVREVRTRVRTFAGVERPADLAGRDAREKMVRRFLLRDQIGAAPAYAAGSVALELLRTGGVERRV